MCIHNQIQNNEATLKSSISIHDTQTLNQQNQLVLDNQQKNTFDNWGFQQDVLHKNANIRTFSNKTVNLDYIEQNEINHLIGKNPPLPSFDVLTPKEEKSLKKKHHFQYKKYKTQKETYINNLNAWGENESMRKHAYRDLLRLRRQGEMFPKIESNADSMMEAYYWANKAENRQIITDLGKAETNALSKLSKLSGLKHAVTGLKEYVGNFFIAMNAYLRKDRDLSQMDEANKNIMTNIRIRNLNEAEESLKMQKMSHQLVTRRYVGKDALKFMLNCADDYAAEEKLKQFIQTKSSKPVLEEKGFYSTAMYSTNKNEMFKNQVEIFILVEKGTKAISIADTDIEQVKGEAELLLAPGTKFQLIDARQNSTYKPGDVKWRLYLQTIPQSDAGIPA